ncbi:hypothetical protein N7499_012341 [Penicillium canescens]|nr:hypothetical protein N7499_012341 [Penicillium canescens]KAJ6154842.1 hypothetical protein N7485_013211 [Penicillium canescens]
MPVITGIIGADRKKTPGRKSHVIVISQLRSPSGGLQGLGPSPRRVDSAISPSNVAWRIAAVV